MPRTSTWMLLYCLVVGAIVPSVVAGPAVANQEVLYRDTKNHYFSMIPPRGWVIETYDDERSKIAWREPTDQRVLLRVIAREATEDFNELLSNATDTRKQLATRGIILSHMLVSLADTTAIVMEGDVPGIGKTRLILFLSGNVHFNCQYAAPTATLYENNLQTAMRSLGTIATLPELIRDPEKKRAQLLSWYIRYSYLMEQLGDSTSARDLAREGLNLFPDNTELQKRAGQ